MFNYKKCNEIYMRLFCSSSSIFQAEITPGECTKVICLLTCLFPDTKKNPPNAKPGRGLKRFRHSLQYTYKMKWPRWKEKLTGIYYTLYTPYATMYIRALSSLVRSCWGDPLAEPPTLSSCVYKRTPPPLQVTWDTEWERPAGQI